VKSGNSEFVIKGNSIGDISYGSSVTTQGSSPKLLAKQAKVMAAMNDVLAAMKTGYLNYRCVQYNFDTTGIKIKMIASAGTVTDTDGNVYQTVKIGNQVWMTENLRVTKYNDGSTIRLETSDITWGNVAMPKYCFYNNTTNSDSIKKYGPLYSWHVVSPTNPKKIAPTGWHVPSEAEWDTLQNYLIAKGYNWDGTTTGDKIGKSLAANTDWDTYMTTLGTPGYDLTKNNSAGFSALPGGYRDGNGFFNQQSYLGNWWSVTEVDATGAWSRILVFGLIELGRVISNKINGISVRLVRD
jgi:uncharacterized protein (TIGR02145 family)